MVFIAGTDRQLRKYLLGSAGSLSQRSIERRFLTRDMELERLRSIEDELIDEYVFGQLSTDEQICFECHFLCTTERKQKVEFSRAMRGYAIHSSGGASRPDRFWRLKSLHIFGSYAWVASLIVTLSALTWMAIQNRELRIKLLLQHQSTYVPETSKYSASLQSIQPNIVPRSNAESAINKNGRPITIDAMAIMLTPGSTRGVGEQSRLEIAQTTSSVQITLRLAFVPKGELEEQLLDANGEKIWSQQTAVSRSQFDNQGLRIILPASLLPPDDYRILVREKLRFGKFEDMAQYTFRVNRLDPR